MRFALPCVAVALLSLPSFAQRIAVTPFGAAGNDARSQVVSALCEQAECVSEKKVTAGSNPDWKKAKKEKVQFFVVGKVVKKGKKSSLELQVQAKAGKPKFKNSWPLEGAQLSDKSLANVADVLGKAMGLAPRKEAAPVEEKKAVEEKKPEPTPEPHKAPEENRAEKKVTPPPAPPAAEVPAEAAVEEPATPKRPVFSLELGIDVESKNFTYASVATANLRSYRAAFILAPEVHGELYPLALFQQNFLAGLGVELGFSIAVGLKSRRGGSDVAYPTNISKFDVALKWQIRPISSSEAYFTPIIGFRSHSFSVGAGSDGSVLDGLPGISYSALKFGLAGELPFGQSGLLAYGRFAVLPVLSAGPIISSAYFKSGSALGIDFGLGLGFKLPFARALQLRLGFDFARYGLSFKSAASDTYVAEGAVDLYLGGNFAVRFTY